MDSTLTALEGIGHADIQLVPFFTDEPKYPEYFCTLNAAAPYPEEQVYGLSVHPDAKIARLKALGEFYERLCLHGQPSAGDPERYRPGGDQLDPARFDFRKPAGDPEVVRQAKLRWMAGYDWSDSRPVRLPSQNVIPGLAEKEAPAPALAPSLSPGGAALGQSGDGGAFQRALYEMVERHATRRFDQDRSAAVRIEGWPPESAPMIEYLERYRLRPRALDLGAYFGVPCVMTALLDSSGVASTITVSHRAASSYGEAMAVGLLESVERRRPARLENEIKFAVHLGPDAQAGKRLYMWTGLDELRDFEPWFDSLPAKRFEDLEPIRTTPEETAQRIVERGNPIYIVDLTLPEVAAAGFEAIRVVIPELGPLA